MRTLLACATIAAFTFVANANPVTVEVTNNQPTGGFSFTPVWHAFHDGSFDAFDSGSSASSELETIAELGNATPLDTAFGGAGVSGVLASPSGPPPFTPGQSNSTVVNVGDSTVNRYFSFASMVIPSNDLFIGNDDPMGIEVYDAGGNFLGPITLEVYGSNVWDAGTEVNDVTDGPAFVDGIDATAGTDENGSVHLFFSDPDADNYLSSLNGTVTPAYTLTDTLTRSDLVATITITPEPASALGIALAGLLLRRRR